ncbi:MAG: tyrosine-type recombinase/integrase [Bacteroidota bacterium]
MTHKDTFAKFSEFLALKRYSGSTINAYLSMVTKFQEFLGLVPMERLNNDVILIKTMDFIQAKGYSVSSHKQVLGALGLFYTDFMRIRVDFRNIYPARREKRLPQILALEEVELLISGTKNLKHRTILMTIYDLGLRRSELLNLKISDIDGNRMLVHIKQAKGKKDRVVPLSLKLLEQLREYYKSYRPKIYLFNGRKGEPYSTSSLRSIFTSACQRAKITKYVTLNSLRHAYATHLMDAGVNIRIIQQLLGHANIKTTMRYTRVTTRSVQNVTSPLDFLNIE